MAASALQYEQQTSYLKHHMTEEKHDKAPSRGASMLRLSAAKLSVACLAVLASADLPLPTAGRAQAQSGSIDQAVETFQRLRGSVTDTYFSNEELHAFMLGMATECSDIMAAFQFGSSAQGLPLLALDVSTTAGKRCDLCHRSAAETCACMPNAHRSCAQCARRIVTCLPNQGVMWLAWCISSSTQHVAQPLQRCRCSREHAS